MAARASIVIIANRRARRLAAGTASQPLLDVLHGTPGARREGLRIVETSTLAELDEAAAAIARDVPDAVVLAGGDGSYMAGVTALARAFASAGLGEEALPPLALAPGGTVSTVARNWGWKGGGLLSRGADRDGSRYAALLLEAIAERRAVVTARPSLRVTDPASTRIGFIVGAGLVSRFFEIYDAGGAPGYAGAAKIAAQVFAGSIGHGALASRVLTPQGCEVTVDGQRAGFDRVSLVCASVVRDLGIGMKLLYRAGEEHERFHVVASPLGPPLLGPQLPLVLAGRSLVGPRVDCLARELGLRFTEEGGAYVLDGELVRADRVTVTAGPMLRILSA
ncbi:MAG: DAG-kinase catalytic domain protein [Labilithrix sp.]|nr:DAG-kinase catalytic domain protein [Labilithrix sp.]